MIIGLATGLLLPVAGSTAFLRLALPDLWIRSRTLVVSLAVPVALGSSSLFFAISLFAFGPHWTAWRFCEIGLWITILSVSLLAARRRQFVPSLPLSFTHRERVAAVLFAATLAVSFLNFYWVSANSPSGSWDAQAIWTLRARFFHRGLEGHWRDAFLGALGWSLPDYPLMLPSSIARLWSYTRSESLLVPIVLAAMFKYATVGMVVGALTAARRRWEAFCAGAVILASFPFNLWGAAQVSDVPLGAFVLASTILLSWIGAQRPDTSYGESAAILTFCAGCAAWTKNEGLVFAAAAYGALMLLMSAHRVSPARTLVLAFGGLLLPLAVLFYFKQNIAPPNYLFQSSTSGGPASRVWEFERHIYILRSFVQELWSWNTSKPIGVIPFVVAYAVAGAALRGLRRHQLIAVLPLFALLCGYYASYALTPLDLKWHIESSLSRLIVQIWPAAVYMCFSLPEAPASAPAAEAHADPAKV